MKNINLFLFIISTQLFSCATKNINTENNRTSQNEQKSWIRDYIRADIKSAQNCYELQLNKNSSLSGRIVFDWDILEGGKTDNIHIQSSTFNNLEIENCLKEMIKKWVFPKPPANSIVKVTYPFVFSNLSKP